MQLWVCVLFIIDEQWHVIDSLTIMNYVKYGCSLKPHNKDLLFLFKMIAHDSLINHDFLLFKFRRCSTGSNSRQLGG